MAFFVLSTLILHLKDKWLLSLIGVVAALLTKEQAVMVVPLVMLMRLVPRAAFWHYGLCLVFVALNFLVLRQALTGSHLAAGILASPGELKLRLIAIAKFLVTDVRILFWPLMTCIITAPRIF